MRYCLMYGFAGIERATIARPSASTGAGLPRLRGARVHAADLLRAPRPPHELLADVAGGRDAHRESRALLHLGVREERELRLRGLLLDALARPLRAAQRDDRVLRHPGHLQRDDAPVAPAEHRVAVDLRGWIERDLELNRPARGALLL